MGKNRDNEQMDVLDEFIARDVISDVLGVVKSGKEATVYCCSGGTESKQPLLAAKVYRSRNVRGFSNDAAYTEGRLRRHNRYERAIASKSRVGRDFAFAKWVADEYATLEILHAAGADVPEPIAQSEHAIIMEYLGDEDEPARMLSNVRLDRDEAPRLFNVVMRNIELALSCDRVHGDLSPFNVLYANGDVRIIDFPQAVDPRFNHAALTLLERDIAAITAYFARFGVDSDPERMTRGLWSRFLRSEL